MFLSIPGGFVLAINSSPHAIASGPDTLSDAKSRSHLWFHSDWLSWGSCPSIIAIILVCLLAIFVQECLVYLVPRVLVHGIADIQDIALPSRSVLFDISARKE